MYLVEDVDGLAEYNWASAVWQFLVDALDETKAKMRTTKNLQVNGFAMLLQVCHDHYNRPGLSFPSIIAASFKYCRFDCTSTVANLTRAIPIVCQESIDGQTYMLGRSATLKFFFQA